MSRTHDNGKGACTAFKAGIDRLPRISREECQELAWQCRADILECDRNLLSAVQAVLGAGHAAPDAHLLAAKALTEAHALGELSDARLARKLWLFVRNDPMTFLARFVSRTAADRFHRFGLAYLWLVPYFAGARPERFGDAGIGLIQGLARYEPERGFSVASYVKYHIIKTFLRGGEREWNGSLMHLPSSFLSRVRRVERTLRKFRGAGLEPDQHELAEAAGLDPRQARDVQRFAPRSGLYLQSPVAFRVGQVKAEDDGCVGPAGMVEDLIAEDETPPADAVLDRRRIFTRVRQAMETLDGRDAAILDMYYGLVDDENLPLREIGDLLGLTPSRVQQLRDRALCRLRRMLERQEGSP